MCGFTRKTHTSNKPYIMAYHFNAFKELVFVAHLVFGYIKIGLVAGKKPETDRKSRSVVKLCKESGSDNL